MASWQVVKEVEEALKIDRNTEKTPLPIPVIEVGLKSIKNAKNLTAYAPATGAQSISVATIGNTNNDYYISDITLTITKDAACDIATGAINLTVTPFDTNVATIVLGIPILTLTAQSQSASIHLTHPLKIARNTTMSLSGTFTAGLCVRRCDINGYLDEQI